MKLFNFNNKKENNMQIMETPVKNVTVEEIHAEFDIAEENILNQCDQLLAELKIPTIDQIVKKAEMLKELGFHNSETVIQSSGIVKQIGITDFLAKSIRNLKQNYPLEKFITIEELERICNKYNLVHAPVINYIKDIPEKNVLEMKNVKKLSSADKVQVYCTIKTFSFWDGATTEYKKFVQDNILNKELALTLETNGELSERHFEALCSAFKGNKGSQYYFLKCIVEVIDKSGLFIAAPVTHFNLKGLDKKTNFGYFKTKTIELKDPVVFEYCNNGIVRIISKWGTDDDKSYLDPILTNEIDN